MSTLADAAKIEPAALVRPAMNPWMVMPLVAMAAFMEVLDSTIVNVSLPHIAGSLSTTVDQSTWVLTSYLVANAIVLPLNGFFTSRLGRKPYFMLCLAIFTTSSLLCGLAPNIGVLLAMRVLQGLGGGGLQPGAQAIMAETLPRNRVGMAMAIYGIVVVVAPVLGPVLGGIITDNLSWRWCFFVNVPVGIIVLFLVYGILQDSAHHQARGFGNGMKFDYIGLSLLSLGLAGLQVMVDRGEDADWFASKFILGCGLVAAIGLVAAFIWEWYTAEPIVNLRLLKNRNFGLTTLGMLIFGAVLYASSTLLPLLAQTLMGYTAKEAGMVLAPGGLIVLVLMPLVGTLITRFSIRWLLVFGVLANVAALELMARLSLHAAFENLVVCRMVQGIGLAFMFVPINTAAFADMPRAQMSSASGIINLARNIGGSVGISLSVAYVKQVSQMQQVFLSAHASTLNVAYRTAVSHLRAAAVAGGAAPANALKMAQAIIYRDILGQAGILAYIHAFRLLGLIFLLLLPLMLLIKDVHKRPVQPVLE